MKIRFNTSRLEVNGRPMNTESSDAGFKYAGLLGVENVVSIIGGLEFAWESFAR